MQIFKNFYFSFLFCLLTYSSPILAQQLEEKPADSIKFGNIVFSFNVDSALLILNNQFNESRFIKSGESIKVKTGRTSVKLSVIHDYLYEEIFALHKDSTVHIYHEFEPLPLTPKVLNGNYAARKLIGSNLLIITDMTSEIVLNDINLGTGHTYTDGLTGKNELQVKNLNSYTTFSYNQKANFLNSDHTFQVVEKYVKPDIKLSKKLAFLPGASQKYKYQSVKSSLIKIGVGLALVSTATFELKYRKNRTKFDETLIKYRESTNSSEVTTLGNRLDELNNRLESDAFLRNLSLASLIGIYVYNVLDGIYTKPAMGYREEKPFEFYLDAGNFSGINGTIKFSIPSK